MFLKFTQKVKAILSLMVLTTLTVVGVVMLPNTSALAQTVSTCACITSEAQPQNGQKARSSGNFSTQGCTTTIQWSLPGGIKVDIKEDISGGKDPTLFNVSNEAKKQNPNKRDIYIANPKGAQKSFEVCALNLT